MKNRLGYLFVLDPGPLICVLSARVFLLLSSRFDYLDYFPRVTTIAGSLVGI